MGRIAAHTQEQVFEAADKLAANGQEVTPTALREVLGRGSFSTLGKHIEAWRQAREAAPAPVILEMPDAVKSAFAQCWQAAAAEAGKEIAAIRTAADAEIKATKRRLDEALSEVERLEDEANSASDALEGAQSALARAVEEAQQAETDAAAREASLSATVVQMRQQIEAQQAELARVHSEAEAARNQHAATLQSVQGEVDRLRGQLVVVGEKLDAANVRERANIENEAAAKAEASRLAEQLKDQKGRSVEVIAELERGKQSLEADLTATRKEAREATTQLDRAQGELEALRTQVAALNDTIRSLANQSGKRAGQ